MDEHTVDTLDNKKNIADEIDSGLLAIRSRVK
jgi:hypothetical protein